MKTSNHLVAISVLILFMHSSIVYAKKYCNRNEYKKMGIISKKEAIRVAMPIVHREFQDNKVKIMTGKCIIDYYELIHHKRNFGTIYVFPISEDRFDDVKRMLLKNRTFWEIYIHAVPPKGHVSLDAGFYVLIDAKTSEIVFQTR